MKKKVKGHYTCNKCINEYKGKFLCKGHAISNKFHDDSSQESQQIAIYLGDYSISYQFNGNRFDFNIDAILTINNNEHFGCLIFNIDFSSFKDNGLFCKKQFKLDALIFLKHLFYKKRLKVSTDFQENISLQQWNAKYIKALFKVLNIEEYNNPIGTYKTFDYSILELNNIKDNDDLILQVDNIENIKIEYAHQLYGLLVSDEGWQYVPELHLSKKFSNNYFSTRKHTCTFIIGYNALIINQTDKKLTNPLKIYSIDWFKKYHHSDSFNYTDFFTFTPCIPGLENHLFQVFTHSAYKNYKLEFTKESINRKSIVHNNISNDIHGLENTLKNLTNILETHAMNMGEIKEAQDYIEKEFGINEKIIDLKRKYNYRINQLESKYNEEQNRSIKFLTLATIAISIFLAVCSSLYNSKITWEKFTDRTYIFIGLISFFIICFIHKKRTK